MTAFASRIRCWRPRSTGPRPRSGGGSCTSASRRSSPIREERARHLALSTTEPDEAVAAELEQGAARAAGRGAQQAASELYAGACRLTPDGLTEELARRKLGQAGAPQGARRPGGEQGAGRGRRRARRRAAPGASTPAAGRHRLDRRVSGRDRAARARARRGGGRPRARGRDPREARQRLRRARSRRAARPSPRRRRDDRFRALPRAGRVRLPRSRPGQRPIRGHGEQPELLERWRECEGRAGPDAPKNLFALIYFWNVDDFEAARARYAVEERWYRERGEELWRAERLGHLCKAEFEAGNWDEAESGLEEACETIARYEIPGPWAGVFRIRALVDAHRGRLERALATFRTESAGILWWEALRLSGLARVESVAGNHAEVDRALTRMHELIDSVGVRDLTPDHNEPIHVESLIALGELARAREELARLEERGRIFPRLWISATLPRTRALVLAAEGDVPAALAALDELDVDAAAKLPFELGRALLVRGRLQRRVKQKRAAADTLREALAIFERLGATAWEAQARAELDRVGLRRSPDELTATERRVADLAATGLTNREVAQQAFMSPKTVQANLTRVYRKLGIRSRAELGARMAEESRQAGPQR